MAKLTITDYTDLSDETSFISKLNSDFTAIEAAIENTLSRDGTSPNTMSDNLDMNSNAITNASSVQTTTLVVNGTALTTDNVAAVDAPTLAGIADANKLIKADASGAAYELTTTVPTDSVATAGVQDGAITAAKIGADAVNGTKIADDSIDSEHYVDGSIDTAHIANSAVTLDKIDSTTILSPVLLNSTAITAVTTLDFPTIFSSNTGYRYFMVVVEGLVPPSGSPSLEARVSVDGSTFESGASDYQWHYIVQDTTVTAITETNSSADDAVRFGGLRLVSDVGTFVIRFDNPHDASNRTAVTFDRDHSTGSVKAIREQGVGLYDSANSAVTGVQLLWSGGETFTANGDVKIYGSNIPF